MAFDKDKFEPTFNGSLQRIAQSEKTTKEELRTLSRSILEAHHATENVGYINRLIAVLSPVNKKAAIVFFTHFSGFSFDAASGMFTKKSKKRYDNAKVLAQTFLDDPLNNLWTWAERHIEVEQKPFAVEGFEKYMVRAVKNAAAAGIDQVELLKAVFKAGIKPDCIIEVMDQLGYDLKEEE